MALDCVRIDRCGKRVWWIFAHAYSLDASANADRAFLCLGRHVGRGVLSHVASRHHGNFRAAQFLWE